MLPTHSMCPRFLSLAACSPTTRAEYFRRLFRLSQMDLDYTFAQMVYLVVSPRKVYQFVSYRKQTKNQCARDDPAFLGILLFLIAMTGLSYGIAFSLRGVGLLLSFLLPPLYFVTIGVVVATAGYLAATRSFYLVNWGGAARDFVTPAHINALSVPGMSATNAAISSRSELSNSRFFPFPFSGVSYSAPPLGSASEFSDGLVEYAYCFDIHCNATFPLFLICFVIQYYLLPFLLVPGFVSAFIGNSLYFVGLLYYLHITALGYALFPFFSGTDVFTCPKLIIVISLAVLSLFGISMTRICLSCFVHALP